MLAPGAKVKLGTPIIRKGCRVDFCAPSSVRSGHRPLCTLLPNTGIYGTRQLTTEMNSTRETDGVRLTLPTGWEWLLPVAEHFVRWPLLMVGNFASHCFLWTDFKKPLWKIRNSLRKNSWALRLNLECVRIWFGTFEIAHPSTVLCTMHRRLRMGIRELSAVHKTQRSVSFVRSDSFRKSSNSNWYYGLKVEFKSVQSLLLFHCKLAGCTGT